MEIADPTGDEPSAASTATGRLLLGRYRIERPLGRGGMGEVLLAHDQLLHRRVAIKRLRAEDASGGDAREAILREARRASQIADPRIAAIHDVLELGDEVLLVMEFVEGATLRSRIGAPVPLEEFWGIALQCVEAVGAAHARGVIHRDLKPENLMLTPAGGIKVLDFGIAKRTPGSEGTTTVTTVDSRVVTGTPPYMAPEAHLGAAPDPRADLFSLGVVFYELLTGQNPFAGATYPTVLARVLNETPPPVADLNPAAGPALSGVVSRMLEKDPAARFASASGLLERLTEVREGRGGAAEPRRRLVVAPRARRFGRFLGVPMSPALGVVAVVLGGALWLGSTRVSLPRERNVAVLAPAAIAGDDFGAFALGAVEWLHTRLRRHADTPGFQVAPFQETFDEKVRTARDARQVLGANLALVPTLEQRPDQLRARLDLIEAGRGRVIASRTIQEPSSRPFEFLDRTYRASAEMLRLTPRGRGAAEDIGVRGAGTLRFHLQGTGRVRAGETLDERRRAVADLEVACRTEPEAAAPRAALAIACLRLQDHTHEASWLARAEVAAREAVRAGEGRSEPHRALAIVLTRRNDPAAADEYRRAYELDPTDDELGSRLGRTYGRAGRAEDERRVYVEAIARRPHDWQPWWSLASWHFRAGRVDSSILAFEEMVRRAPALSKGHSSLGGLLVLRGEYPRAIEALRRSVELRPTKIAFDNLGTAYFNSGRLDDAVAAYNQSFQFGFADYVSWLNLGDAYFWLRGRKDLAAEAYAQSVRLGREEIVARREKGRTPDPMILANLATVFPKLGEPDTARAWMGRAIAADSANPMVAYCAALTWWQLGEKPRGIEWIDRSVRGGYPVVWLRDSPIFREWREDGRFRALIAPAGAQPLAARNRGERR